MKYAALAIAFALLSCLAYADYTAYFSPDSSAFTLSVQNATMSGHFGNYSVFINVFPLPSSVTVAGEQASQQALASEIGWLVKNRVLETTCNYTVAYSLSYSDYYCGAAGEWKDCAQAAECTKAPIAPPSNAPLPEIFGAQKTAAAVRSDATATGGQANGQAGAAPQTGQQVSLEQIGQLLAAAIAVIVASYLMLQRQAQPQIDPQEERLLENETRAGILEELSFADKIPTDLSAKLGKSKATVVEHLDTLLSAGFVERISTPGRKFVFYRLTRKGKQALLRRAG